MEKIKRVSGFFKRLFQLIFIVLPILLIVAWSSGSPESLVLMHGIINLSFIPPAYSHHILHVLSASEKIAGFCVSAIPMAVDLYIVYSLIQLFSLYEKGDIFSIKNVRCIRRIGYALLFTQIANVVSQCLMGVAIMRYNPPGHRFIAMSVDQTNLGIVFMALLVILISWIMMEACRLREEQALTV